ncbi:MAG: preprotein translocase subunit SecG [Pseudomonadota bacterium]
MFSFLLVVQILVSISIITLVMLQQGKGADMGAAFGSGASGTVFGARGSGSFFTKATGFLAAVFFINCLLIASPLIRQNMDSEPQSVADQIEQQAVEDRQAADAEKVIEALEQKAAEDQAQPGDVPEIITETVVEEDIPAANDEPAANDAPAAGADDLPQ